MALILKTNDKENNFYQKIILERCYINIDGLYIATLVFKNKEERDKDKVRQKDVLNFISNYEFKLQEVNSIQDEQLKFTQKDIFAKVESVAQQLFSYMYIGANQNISERANIFPEDYLTESEKYGFKREWFSNPSIIIREDLIRVDDYKKQDFTLESFYQSLKENIYTDINGNILAEDDL
jgi:hypothetical protein